MLRRIWVATLCMSLSCCVESFPPPIECGSDDDCYIKHTLDTMGVVASQIDYWDNITLVAALAGFAGIVATIMLALQGDENKYWTRPVGIVATALVTGVTALLTSFHLPENTDKYIMAYVQLGALNNNFERDLRVAKTPDEKDALRFQYAGDYSRIKADLLKTKGSLSLVSRPPPPSPENPPAKPRQDGS